MTDDDEEEICYCGHPHNEHAAAFDYNGPSFPCCFSDMDGPCRCDDYVTQD